MPKGENTTQRTGELDRETGWLVDAGYVRCSEVKLSLGIPNHKVWQRTLAAAGISVTERGRVHWLRIDDARRLLAGRNPAKPP